VIPRTGSRPRCPSGYTVSGSTTSGTPAPRCSSRRATRSVGFEPRVAKGLRFFCTEAPPSGVPSARFFSKARNRVGDPPRSRRQTPASSRERRDESTSAAPPPSALDVTPDALHVRGQYTETLIGQLVGGSLPRHRFELALPDDQIVTGSVADDVLPLLSHFSFGARCRAEIVVAVVSTPAGLTRQSRTLVGLDDVED
jgi:hypothetical protein